jgi:hypothetical protein
MQDPEDLMIIDGVQKLANGVRTYQMDYRPESGVARRSPGRMSMCGL